MCIHIKEHAQVSGHGVRKGEDSSGGEDRRGTATAQVETLELKYITGSRNHLI